MLSDPTKRMIRLGDF